MTMFLIFKYKEKKKIISKERKKSLFLTKIEKRFYKQSDFFTHTKIKTKHFSFCNDATI